MKKYFLLLFAAVTLASCSKDDPTPEIDQEELGTATLTFTPVEVTLENGVKKYEINTEEQAESITFKGSPLLPPVGAHLDLHVGDTYKLELKTTDFAGRESQQTFISKAEVHQAFLLGAQEGTLDLVYADNQVGVTAYITILKEAETTVLQYIMRHLNPGVKSKISTADWNNKNYLQYTGANDLDLKFEVHFVKDSHGH